ncbi:MAG: cytochrome c biogenesis protein CcsA [Pseudomonadota bacterium]
MLSLALNISAIVIYLIASGFVLLLVYRQESIAKPSVIIVAIAAIVLHGLGIWQLMGVNGRVDLSIDNMTSLIALLINVIVVISCLRKPLHNLWVFLFPISVLCIALSLSIKPEKYNFIDASLGVISHILLSIVAYCLITMTALQALLWSWQNHKIKTHQLSGPAKLLPPLQTMESLIYELLTAGVALLALGILTGLFYLDDIFAQHLVHKTVLSVFALVVFLTLLGGRYALGWRGNTAVKWILSGFCLLMLAYFGSKLVLEIIL